jgi:ParB family chromosome partitioning protein
MRKALGKGLDALFPAAAPHATPAVRTTVPVGEIAPNPVQPRRHFEDEALATLADSIARHGLLQPLVVRRTDAGYELIAGERRLRAATRAGLAEVPVVVRETAAADRLELALIENLQRADLSPLEEAEAYRRLVDEYGLTQEEIARRVGKSRPAIANALRLLTLPDSVKTQVQSGELSAGHARAVLSVEGVDAQVLFAREISVQKLSKSGAENLAAARRTRIAPVRKAPATSVDVHVHAVAEELTRSFGTRVRIHKKARGGSIEIEFYSDAELDRLIDTLRRSTGAHG